MPYTDASKFIAIEGVLKSENTALAKALAKLANARTILEEDFISPLVNIHSSDPADMLFKKHILHLLDRFKSLKPIAQTEIFYDRVICDSLFYADRIYANLKLNGDDLRLYDTLVNFMEKELAIPDLVIYLQTNAETILEKMQGRHAIENTSRERSRMDEEYIHALNDEFNQFFLYYRWSPVLIVNANQLDQNDPAQIKDLYEKVLAGISGVTYYNPSPSES